MSEARDQIFAALQAASASMSAASPSEARPKDNAASPFPWPAMPEHPVERFRTRIEQAGGQFEIDQRGDWTQGEDWPLAPQQAQHLFSECEALPSRGVGLEVAAGGEPENIDRNRSLRQFEPLEICILKGAFGVVENGAVWHAPTSPAVRAAALLAEHLVIVLPADALVATLHQAYDRIGGEADEGREARSGFGPIRAPFGWFLCGPSKTADIEQSLVFGAHGPKTMRLVLLDDSGENEMNRPLP